MPTEGDTPGGRLFAVDHGRHDRLGLHLRFGDGLTGDGDGMAVGSGGYTPASGIAVSEFIEAGRACLVQLSGDLALEVSLVRTEA